MSTIDVYSEVGKVKKILVSRPEQIGRAHV